MIMKLVSYSSHDFSCLFVYNVEPNIHSNVFKEHKKKYVNISKSSTKHGKNLHKTAIFTSALFKKFTYTSICQRKNEAVACYQNSLEVKSGDSKFIVKVVKWFGLKEKKMRER